VLAELSYDPFAALQALQTLAPRAECADWDALLDAYARCVRITRDQPARYGVDRRALTLEAELALYEAQAQASARLAAQPDMAMLLAMLDGLVPVITRFFEDVLVMDKDEALRRNRLGLLQSISALTEGIVDLSLVEGF